MDDVKMQWVECPLLDDDGSALHPPSCSDDEDEDHVVDRLNRREGHCATVLTSSADGGVQSSLSSWIVVCGGYTKGVVSAVPLVAPASLLPALQWRELPIVDVFERDGASLTTVEIALCVAGAQHDTAMGNASTAYLFGGFDGDMNLCNALYAVTLCGEGDETGIWTPTTIGVREVTTTGDVPTPRARHGAGGRDGRLFLFGGETATQEQTNDLYVCDVRTGVWRALTASSVCPAPRLLSLSLVFTSPTTFVVYGGAHFVEGAVQSFADVWKCDIDTEAWTPVAVVAGEERDLLPHSNGHAGGAVVLPSAPRRTCAVFVGGKNVAEGDDRVRMIGFSPHDGSGEVRVRAALPAVDTGSFPHWRYTPAVVATPKGLLLLAGQCRHAQVPSSFLLTFA
ncbi:hypothetical protein ABB37_01644 [Leptomonas pyrrhocoris]|uniref:Uncharacterized protein n=1 Tax=Leptomonas pyrrhocoris TaxID=157538 RepID=A0A0M9G915_LEPPY|nr:hypothetical protein ABB37_01644 [Leptomonas pyrrhocoris]KPA85310.1 hypothetical protein ABB37_01644 [Leptomonas pyrrhocoris]|eukprot:XP_015663749.1 hypothetical protein ABB37_01644 [Leptomonas pyrrhocoris]